MSKYCGFVCQDYVDKARDIRKALQEFSEHNPEEAKVVLANVVNALFGEDDKMETRRSQHRS